MTDRELELIICDNCSSFDTVDYDAIGEYLVPYINNSDYNDLSVKVLENTYMDVVDEIKTTELPSITDLSHGIHDDYLNRQYACVSIEIARENDHSMLTPAQFRKLVEERVESNLDSDSYGGFLNYTALAVDYFNLEENPVGAISLTTSDCEDISSFLDYSAYMENPGLVRDKVETLYENDIVRDIVVNDSQMILVPELVEDNCFFNGYNELCIVPDNKLLRGAVCL